MSCIKKPEQNLLSWASFPDGDFVKYFTIDEVGNWFWKENTKEIPQVPQIWLTSSHIVKDGSIVSSSVSLLIGMLIYENDGSEIQKRIYKAFMEQGPTRNPMFKQEHSVLINSVIAQRVTTLKPAEGKWLSQNFYAYRIPIIQLEYNVQGHTEAELLHNQIAAYLYNLKLRTRDQNQQTLFRMYSSEWRDWVLHVTAINALFEKIYYNKLYKDLGKSPKNIVNKLIKESPGCLQMLIKSWKSLWFKDLHFELIIRNMIEDNNNIEFYQHFSDIIRSYGFCNSEKLPVTTRSINNNSFTVNSLGDLPLTPIPFGDVEDKTIRQKSIKIIARRARAKASLREISQTPSAETSVAPIVDSSQFVPKLSISNLADAVKTVDPRYRITKSPQKAKLNPVQSVKFRNFVKLTDRQYDNFHRFTDYGVSLSTLRRTENRMFNQLYPADENTSLVDLVISRVNNSNADLGELVKVTIGADKGSDSVKIVFYLNDNIKALSTDNVTIFASYTGDENYEMLQPYMNKLGDALKILRNGVETLKGFKKFDFFMTGDMKYYCTIIGLQGGSSLKGCVWCSLHRSNWTCFDFMPLRTIENIIDGAKKGDLAKSALKRVSKAAIDKIHRKNDNIIRIPLIEEIPVANYVPGPTHILISLINTICKITDMNEGPSFRQYIQSLKVSVHFPAQEYVGNQCRFLVKHFEDGNCSYNGMAKDLMLASGKVQNFAVARYLSNEELDEFEDSVEKLFKLLDRYKEINNKNKLHALRCHVIPFARKHLSWGLFSEQSLESIHHLKNLLDVKLRGRKDSADLMKHKLFKKKQAISNLTASTTLTSFVSKKSI